MPTNATNARSAWRLGTAVAAGAAAALAPVGEAAAKGQPPGLDFYVREYGTLALLGTAAIIWLAASTLRSLVGGLRKTRATVQHH